MGGGRNRKTQSCRLFKKVRLLTLPTLARQDAPYPKQGRSSLVLALKRVAWLILDCARTEDHQAPSPPFFSSLLCCQPGCLPMHDPNSHQDKHYADDFVHTHRF